MSEPLKPCPFCGSEEVSLSHNTLMDDTPGDYYIECHKCAALGPTTEHSGIEVAAARWNDRP